MRTRRFYRGPGLTLQPRERAQRRPMSSLFLLPIVIGWMLPCSRTWGVDVLARAAVGQPYGVATVELPLGVPVPGREYAPIEVTDEDGRVLFSVANDIEVEVGRPSERTLPSPGGGRLLGRVSELVRELAGDRTPTRQTVSRRVSFLFVGSEPMRITLRDVSDSLGSYQIVPQIDPAAHPRLMAEWWNGYTNFARAQMESADYPTVVEAYLVAMLSGRTGMPLPDWYLETKQEDDQLLNALKLIAGAEGASDAMFRRAAAGTQVNSPEADLPLPAPPAWMIAEVAGGPTEVEVEPLATRVPPECFYIRYGSFANFLWFQDLSSEHGGDISRMVTLRGIDHSGMQRVEDQLVMKMTQLSRMLGGTVIEDQAIIGRDLFLADGASIGVLIKSNGMLLLQTSVNNDRAKLANGDPSVTLKQLKIRNRDVSLLSSADHRVRSFMVVDGEYLFVANSRSMIERFLEVGESGESLAATPSFRLARQLMPLARNDTIFAYFSPQMLRSLVSPQYLIELRRRLYAHAELTMVHLARMAAALEADNETSSWGIDELAERGFLPAGFGNRPDGSGAVAVGTAVIDTLRGARRSFLPIADVEVDAVTPDEAAWYESIAQEYSNRFPDFDPIMLGVQRQTSGDDASLERVTIHAEIAPWDPGKYGKLAQQLGPPTTSVMRFPPDDVVTVQAHVASALLGPPTHLFAGIKDSRPPEPEAFDGILGTYFSLRQLPGYLGAWPQPGALDRLPLGLGRGQPIGPGMARLIGGLYRYTDGQFSVISFHHDLLQASLPHLAAVQANDSAQVRLQVANLNGSQLEAWVTGQLYDRASVSSAAGANYLTMLSRQLQIEPGEVKGAAEKILAAKLQCTLGGEYQPSTSQPGRWISTAWNGETPPETAPADYIAPILAWFRGANASLTQYDDRVLADAVIEIERR